MDDAKRKADAIECEAWKAMYEAAPRSVVEALGLHVLEVEDATLFLAPRLPTGQFNRAIGLGNDRPPSEEAIEAVVASARDAGSPVFLLHAFEGSILAERLARRGFALARRRAWAKMLHDGPLPEVRTSLRIGDVPRTERSALARVLAAAHGMPPPIVPWVEAMIEHPGYRAFGAYDGETLVAGGLLFLGKEGAWLGLGGTSPSHRNRGAQGALMVRRVEEAIGAGVHAIETETGEPVDGEANPSLANMVRTGFRKVGSRLNFVGIG